MLVTLSVWCAAPGVSSWVIKTLRMLRSGDHSIRWLLVASLWGALKFMCKFQLYSARHWISRCKKFVLSPIVHFLIGGRYFYVSNRLDLAME